MNTAHDSYFSDNFDDALQDFKDCGWEKVFDGLPGQDCSVISQKLYEAAAKAESAGNEPHAVKSPYVVWEYVNPFVLMIRPRSAV